MEENEREVEGMEWRKFNEPCLGDFLSRRKKDLRGKISFQIPYF